MDRELVHSLLYLSPVLENALPEQRSEMERSLSLFERLIPTLTHILAPSERQTVKPAEATLPKTQNTATSSHPAAKAFAAQREPAIVGSHHGTQNQRSGSVYAGGNIPFKRSFLNRSRIIKGT